MLITISYGVRESGSPRGTLAVRAARRWTCVRIVQIRGVLDPGDDAECAAAIRTDLNVDLEHSFQVAALESRTNGGGM